MNRPTGTHRFALQCLLSLAVVVSGCSGTDSAGEWGGTIRDSAGVRIVQNPAQGLWEADERWTVTEALTIGADSMDLPYQFGRITDIAVGSDGSIFVLDGLAAELRVFDSAGVHVRTIGRQGEGPGEFSRAVAGVFATSDGRLGLPDMSNSRLNWIDPNGEFLGSVPLSYDRGFPVRWDDDGSGEIVVQRRAMGMNEDAELAAGDPLVRIARDGSEERLVLLPLAQTVRMEGARPVFTYFETEPSWDVGPSGTLRTAMTQEYRIEVRDRDGTLRAIVSKEIARHEVTAADRDHFEELMREALVSRGTAPDAVERFITGLEYGTTLPAFNRITEGPEGTMLVQQIQALHEMTSIDLSEEQSRRLGSNRWDVFDVSGRYLGAVELPMRFTPMVWEDSAVYGRWLDDADVHHVRKLDLMRPEASSS